jgi:hypothetical protein
VAVAKLNCWEFKKCGRQPGGEKAHELGVCPAYTQDKLHGVHGGRNSGRACWVVAGTYCKGEVQGTFVLKCADCMKCDFYKLVQEEEKKNFIFSSDLLMKLRQKD